MILLTGEVLYPSKSEIFKAPKTMTLDLINLIIYLVNVRCGLYFSTKFIGWVNSKLIWSDTKSRLPTWRRITSHEKNR